MPCTYLYSKWVKLLVDTYILITEESIALALAGLLGLCVGSFLNVVIYRIPVIMRQEWRKESAIFWQDEPDLTYPHKQALMQATQNTQTITLSFPPSRCPKCSHKIGALENIPILSWLFLKGKCKGCKTPISMRYPLVELTTALLSFLVIYQLGATTQGLLGLFFTWILIALTGIDWDTQLLPDRLVYPLGMLGLGANAFGLFTSTSSSVFGVLIGFLVFYLIAKIYMLLTKKEGMGFGDFKLLAALGAWFGIEALPMIVLLSSVSGVLIGGSLVGFKKSKVFAFGPYLALAGFVYLLWGKSIMSWYLA